MSKFDATIIVLNWNGQQFLKDCFDSIKKQSYPRKQYEVMLLDNASSDDSIEFVSKHYPDVVIVKSPTNVGFSGGMNLGMRKSKGEYMILLNNDTILDPHWLEELMKVAHDKKAGAVTSKLMFLKKKGVINNAGSMLQFDNTWPIKERGINEKDVGQYDRVEEITAYCGASVALHRNMIKKIGLLDESFRAYFEDTDLSWRGQKAGFKYYYVPKSVLYHVHTGTNVEGSPRFVFYISRNRVLILFKNGKLHLALLAFGAMTRDRVLATGKHLVGALLKSNGRRKALTDFVAGIKTWLSTILLIPVMLLKRWHVIGEKKIS